jgi:hypothetical protein
MITKITNIAQLRTRKGTTNSLVETLGYYTASDGGNNTYQWNSSSVLSDNGGTIIAVTGVATGRWISTSLIVNLKQFGAKGDGTTNDTTAVAAAIATNKNVFIPMGTYIITSNLVLNSNQQVYGEGAESVLKAGADGLRDFVGINGKTNVTVSNFKIDGGGQTTNVFTGYKYCFGVTVYNSSNITIENLTIDKCGIARSGTSATIIDDNLWGGMGIIVGARYGAVKNVLIRNCRISNIASGGNIVGDGVYIEGFNANPLITTENIVVENCYVENVGRHCFTAAGEGGASAFNVVFKNCTGRNSALSGIDFEEAEHSKFIDSEFQGCGTYTAYYDPSTIPSYGATYRLRAAIATGNESHNNYFNNIRIRSCYYGITWGGGGYNTWSNIIVTNSVVNDIYLGLARFAENNTISNCKFLTTGKTINPFFNMIIVCNTLVEGCVFASTLNITGQQQSKFVGNIFQKKVTIGFDCKDILFENNIFTDTTGLSFETIGTLAEDFTVKNNQFVGAGASYFFGVYAVYNSIIRLNIIGNTFRNYLGDVSTDGCGVFHLNSELQNAFGIISNNNFINSDYGIKLYQGGKYTIISANSFSNISKWCIYIQSISSALALKAVNFTENIADNTCVNGLWIECPTGTWDYCTIRNNRFQDVTTVDYLLNALDFNTNGITEAPTLIRPVITKTAGFTLTKLDAGKIFYMNSSSAMTVTIPADATANIRIGTMTTFVQMGAGQVTFTAIGGANVHSEGAKFKTAAQRALVNLTKTNYEESILSGERAI